MTAALLVVGGVVLSVGGLALIRFRHRLNAAAGRLSERVGWTEYESKPQLYIWIGSASLVVGVGWLVSVVVNS